MEFFNCSNAIDSLNRSIVLLLLFFLRLAILQVFSLSLSHSAAIEEAVVLCLPITTRDRRGERVIGAFGELRGERLRDERETMGEVSSASLLSPPICIQLLPREEHSLQRVNGRSRRSQIMSGEGDAMTISSRHAIKISNTERSL